MCYACKINSAKRVEKLRVLSASGIDPTRTLTLRNSFASAMAKRFDRLKGLITKSIVDNNCFGYGLNVDLSGSIPVVRFNQAIGQEQFAFERDQDKIEGFMAWLDDQVQSGILEVYITQQVGQAIEQAWTNTYIKKAYQKGVQRGRVELRKRSYPVPTIDDTPGGINAIMNSPVHADRAGVVYTRTFNGLKGITQEMSNQISRELADGLTTGAHPREIAKKINDRVDKIGKTRAKVLARTETIRAHHVATVQEYKNWGVAGVTVLAELVTAGDGRVCPICKRAARKNNGYGPGVYTLDQAMGLIPLHPQCRCVVIPLDISDNAELQEKLKDAA